MARRKAPTATQPTAPKADDNGQAAPQVASTAVAENPEAAAPAAVASQSQTPALTAGDAQGHAAAVQAPAQGLGRSWTVDNRVGYRKEDSPDGRKRQIRFADREGGQRPDDELLAVVREQKPVIAYSGRERAWQARKDEEGLTALDAADQRLAEIGRKRTGGPRR